MIHSENSPESPFLLSVKHNNASHSWLHDYSLEHIITAINTSVGETGGGKSLGGRGGVVLSLYIDSSILSGGGGRLRSARADDPTECFLSLDEGLDLGLDSFFSLLLLVIFFAGEFGLLSAFLIPASI